jgi:hypothetical protein
MNEFQFIESRFWLLKEYCEKEGFKGYDPFDGLNSKLFNSLPLLANNKYARLAWIQFFKRSPVNLRPLTGVGKSYNAKALALFLSGYCALYKVYKKKEYLDKISFFTKQILELRALEWKHCCWGYNFDWQSRLFFQPKFTPNVVVSTFVANALLDAYELVLNDELLSTARSTCDFILNDLNRSYNAEGEFCFSYTPRDNAVVYNASLLASRLLARVYSYTNEEILIGEAKKSVSFCCNSQNEDGSWGYGNQIFNQWIDNFHTGYNLECIHDYMGYTGDATYKRHLDKGFDYYINTFFTADGIPKYYSNSIYPIDVHSPSQMVITLIHLNKVEAHRDVLHKVLVWTLKHMQDKKGFFYYQKNNLFLSKIPYMRWSQAWMFYALSHYLSKEMTNTSSGFGKPEVSGVKFNKDFINK